MRCRQSLVLSLALLAIILAGMSSASAAAITWNAVIGDWSVPWNWGGTLPTAADMVYIANDNTATITTPGAVCGTLLLGAAGAGQSGTVEMMGGTLTADYESVGQTNFAETLFKQSGGTNTVKSGLLIGNTGQYQFTGGSLQINRSVTNRGVFDFGNRAGVMNLTGSGIVNLAMPGSSLLNTGAATLTVGPNALLIVPSGFNPNTAFAHYSNSGMLHTAGTPFNVPSGQTYSYWGDLADHVNCEGTFTGQYFHNGLTVGASGSAKVVALKVEDANSGMSGGSLDAVNEWVGYNGTGIFEHSGGNNSSSFIERSMNLYLGYNSGSNGTYNLSGSGQIGTYLQIIGYSGSGTFNQSSGINVSYDRLGNEYSGFYLGWNAGSTGTYNLTGGILQVGEISKGKGTAIFNFGGGTIQGVFGSMLDMTLTGIGGDANVDCLGVSHQASALGGALSGPGGLHKLGQGELIVTGNNSYSGGTTISAGTLIVNNKGGSGTGSGPVVVNSTGTLSGSGFIGGPVTVNDGGTLAPGNSPGILTVNNQVTLQPGATLSIEVNGLTVGTQYDQLSTTGPVSLSGSLALSFGSFTPTGDDTLILIDNTGSGPTTGQFQYADDEKIGTFNGVDWYITYDADNGTIPSRNGGNDVAIYSVPEPGQIALLISACAGIMLAWRKRGAVLR